MPASPNVLPSVDLALKAAGNPVAFTTGGTLTVNQALDDAFHDLSANFMGKTTGARSWSASGDGLVDSSGGSILTGHDASTPLSVTIGGVAVKGMTEAGLTLSMNVAEIVNATTGLDRALDPAARMAELSLSFDYYDPAATGSGGFLAILDALTGVTADPLAVVFTAGGLSLSFDARPSTASLTKSAGDIVKSGVTLSSTGVVTNGTSGMGAGLSALMTAFFGAGRATPLTVLVGTTTADNTEYTGSAYPASIGLTVPFASQATVSVTMEGTGPLTRQATT